ncbi:hypothetical protein [Natrinema thermotolerans]|uniref:hypothetical protein n=1 Tax=Natrinema thermotolerans TaxID=121872 RepID=UPI00067991C4|nr:hypothetical protein [Natrinema thermotolerans]QCC57260.1 hypothetical protein DVR14_00880 [Natrinema thermotolerans]
MAQNTAVETESPEIDATFEHSETGERVTVVEHMFDTDYDSQTPFVVERESDGEQVGFQSPSDFFEDYELAERNDTKRFDGEFGLDEVIEGDRIDPAMIPRSPNIEIGETVARHLPNPTRPEDGETDDREFTVRIIARGSDRYNDVQTALVYDPEADLFARLGGHTSSGAMNQAERDWKVRDVGSEVAVTDTWDVEIPDLEGFNQTEREFIDEWVELAFDNARYGDDIAELVNFDGKTFRFRDHDNREATIQYELVTGDDE